jgi:hypothetical protein
MQQEVRGLGRNRNRSNKDGIGSSAFQGAVWMKANKAEISGGDWEVGWGLGGGSRKEDVVLTGPWMCPIAQWVFSRL